MEITNFYADKSSHEKCFEKNKPFYSSIFLP